MKARMHMISLSQATTSTKQLKTQLKSSSIHTLFLSGIPDSGCTVISSETSAASSSSKSRTFNDRV